MSEIGLDYYLIWPWDPPEERPYPIARNHIPHRYGRCIVGGGSAGPAARVYAAPAVGEAMSVYLVHRYLATI